MGKQTWANLANLLKAAQIDRNKACEVSRICSTSSHQVHFAEKQNVKLLKTLCRRSLCSALVQAVSDQNWKASLVPNDR